MTSQTAARRVRERHRRAGRGWGLERQRAHRALHGAAPLSEEAVAHVALVEAVASGQREQVEALAVADVGSEGAVAKRSPSGVTSAPSEAPVVHPGRGSSSGGRDPRLGPYRNVGAFLEHCWKRLGLTREQVLAIAGVDEPEALLDFEGVGLRALYAACAEKARAA